MRQTFLLLAAASLAAAPPATAQSRTTPDDTTLAAITERGRALAAYGLAARHGGRAIAALREPTYAAGGQYYVARPTAAGWVVAFGRVSASRDTFFVAYEATPRSAARGETTYAAAALPRPLADTGYYARAARAMEVARAAYVRVQGEYDVAALPRPDGRWWVYVVPAATVPGVFPLGDDARFVVSADGRTIQRARRLHNSVIDFDGRAGADKKGETLLAGTHTAVVDDVPEDTDVSHVLTRTPRVPEVVVTDSFVFRVEVDGAIRMIGPNDDPLGRK
jgi:hypothetical protein